MLMLILSPYIEPPLTTVGYDKQQMGNVAGELLLSKIAKEEPKSVIVENEKIIERQSVKSLLNSN